MTALHAHYTLRNQQAFQRLLDASAKASAGTASQASISSATAAISTSGGRSWSKSGFHAGGSGFTGFVVDVNARDWLGRTVLHCAVSALDNASLEYVKLLLGHPKLDVNAVDTESRWSALHRAIYVGNLAACLLLLARSDTNTSLKDFEGYTAFDLYNSTVEGTKPTIYGPHSHLKTLYTWGTNRNASLGTGDSDDRTYPDEILLRRQERDQAALASLHHTSRFTPLAVKEIQMSRLHTVVVTSESTCNIRACGFGSGGRLGSNQHTQYSLVPVPLPDRHTIRYLALGQDHTLALTVNGDVLSWGLNRFFQLGYLVEQATSGLPPRSSIATIDEPIQAIPRKIIGLLRREIVKGVAACKTASACWTEREVFTWGTNSGQLGYDKSAQPVQILPRKVSMIANAVIGIALTDTAMACLTQTHDVVCFSYDRYFRVNFPTQSFPPSIHQTYRPPTSANNASIAKLACCDNNFAALTSNGEIFTFAAPGPVVQGSAAGGGGGGMVSDGGLKEREKEKEKAMVRPQRVWALRNQYSAAKDVALASDGTIILCTDSGHVYIRSRNPLKGTGSASSSGCGSSNHIGGGGTKTFKFQRVPYIQRVVRVVANSTGAFGAVKEEVGVRRIKEEGREVWEDVGGVAPFMCFEDVEEGSGEVRGDGLVGHDGGHGHDAAQGGEEDVMDALEKIVRDQHGDEDEDAGVERDVAVVRKLCRILTLDREMRKKDAARGVYSSEGQNDLEIGGGDSNTNTTSSTLRLAHGADLVIKVGGTTEIPAHRVILAARCPAFAKLLSGLGSTIREGSIIIKFQGRQMYSTPGNTTTTLISRLSFTGCHPLTVLLLLHYLYTDDLLAIWDRRIGSAALVEQSFTSMKAVAGQVRLEMQGLAGCLGLGKLGEALAWHGRRAVDRGLAGDLGRLYVGTQQEREQDASVTRAPNVATPLTSPTAADTIIRLAKDARVYCHSVILRARVPFFMNFFGDGVWTDNRWSAEKTVEVGLEHLSERVMGFVMRWVYGGEGEEMFECLDFVESMDDVLEFLFSVIAAADELGLDRLSLICSRAILNHVNIYNACAILTDATHYHAAQLVTSLQHYLACNMETLLESRMLDDLPNDIIKQLAAFLRDRQAEKLPITRSNVLVNKAMDIHAEWLALQDIPQPIVRSKASVAFHRSPKLSPVSGGGGKSMSRRQSAGQLGPLSPLSSPNFVITPSPIARASSASAANNNVGNRRSAGDDIFAMDDADGIPALSLEEPRMPVTYEVPSSMTPPSGGAPWKGKISQLSSRVDLRSIMAEAEKSKPSIPVIGTPPAGKNRVVGFNVASTSESGPARSSTSSPWRVPSAQSLSQQNSSPGSSTPLTPSNMMKDSARGNASPAAASGLTRMVQDNVPTTPGSSRSVSSPATPGSQSKTPLGPTFLPSRQLPVSRGTSTPRRVSENSMNNANAWTAPPTHPIPEPVINPGNSASPPSFLAIQLQQEIQNQKPAKEKKSLLQIQEEEQARQAEADFMKWWAEEEERIRQEEMLLNGGGRMPTAGGEGEGKKKSRSHKSKTKTTSGKQPVEGQKSGGEQSAPKFKNPRPAIKEKRSRPSVRQEPIATPVTAQ